jgi:hypothetical protein
VSDKDRDPQPETVKDAYDRLVMSRSRLANNQSQSTYSVPYGSLVAKIVTDSVMKGWEYPTLRRVELYEILPTNFLILMHRRPCHAGQ